MALWCRNFPTVSVELGRNLPRRVTLVVPFYENHDFIKTQVFEWRSWPEVVREHVEIIVVDDGSPRPLALSAVDGLRLRQFRIDVDVRWNWLAARNIGAHHASGEWLLLTDIDHIVPTEAMTAAVYGRLDPAVAYGFQRREHTGHEIHPHSASFLMTKSMFWKIGGYDETLSGHYGTDGDWRRRMAAFAQIQILSQQLERHEHVGDSSTQTYLRKQPQDAAVKALIANRGKHWRPKTLSFPYHEEAPCPAS